MAANQITGMGQPVDQLFPASFDVYGNNETVFSSNDHPIDDEPLYVNAKQYFRILKRRVARARLEEVHRLSRQRKVTLSKDFSFPLFKPMSI